MEIIDSFSGLPVRDFENRKCGKTHHLETREQQETDATLRLGFVVCPHASRLQHSGVGTQGHHGRKRGIFVLASARR
jgi:hypothetical protein